MPGAGSSRNASTALRSVRAVAVTAGEVCPEPRAEFYAEMDAANVDLKAFTERFYRTICAGELAPVLDTLRFIRHETDVWLEITTLLIPGENDSAEEIDDMTRWVVEELGTDVPMHFTAFHPDWRMQDKRHTSLASLRQARNIARENGVRYAYTGNVRDAEGSATICHGCRATLIAREGYMLTRWGLTDDGHCIHYGARCSGVFCLWSVMLMSRSVSLV